MHCRTKGGKNRNKIDQQRDSRSSKFWIRNNMSSGANDAWRQSAGQSPRGIGSCMVALQCVPAVGESKSRGASQISEELASLDNLDRLPANVVHIRTTSHSTLSCYYPGAVRCTCHDNQTGGYFSDSANDKESNVQQATTWPPKKPKGIIIKHGRPVLGSNLHHGCKGRGSIGIGGRHALRHMNLAITHLCEATQSVEWTGQP